MKRVVVASAARTPIGCCGGGLSSVPAVHLAGAVLKQVVRQAEIDPGMVDDVIMGHVYQVNNGVNSGRRALLVAGWPGTVPGMTLDRHSCSGLDAVFIGVMKIQTGNADIVVAGGMESMSQTGPLKRAEPPAALKVEGFDAAAKLMGISRQKADRWALRSHERALLAVHNQRFANEVTPVSADDCEQKQQVLIQVDELPNQSLTIDHLNRLKPYVYSGICTVGNSAPAGDGAAAVVLMSEEKAHKLGITPLAYFRSCALSAMAPGQAYPAVGKAAAKALRLANLRIDEIDLIEVQELSAAQALVDIHHLGIPQDEVELRVNANGSSIALGHPLAATGTMRMVSLLYEMTRRQARFGLETLCGAGGQGICAIFETYRL